MKIQTLKGLGRVVCLMFAIVGVGYGQSSPSPTPPQAQYSESTPYTPTVFRDRKGNVKVETIRSCGKNAPASAVSTLTIPATVLTANGKLVAELKAPDFEVLIDNQKTEVVFVEKKEGPLNVILLLDASPSTSTQFNALKELALKVVSKFRPEDLLTIASFNEKLRIVVPATTDRSRINKAISRLSMGSGTSVYDSICELFEGNSAMASPPAALIIMTDGVDTTSRRTYQQSLVTAEMKTTRIFPVYFDTYLDFANLKVIQMPGQNSTPLKADYDLGRSYLDSLIALSGGRAAMASQVIAGKRVDLDSIPFELANQYHVRFLLPSFTIPNVRHSLTVRVRRPGLTILTKGSLILP